MQRPQLAKYDGGASCLHTATIDSPSRAVLPLAMSHRLWDLSASPWQPVSDVLGSSYY
ncbi:hypothetical protein VTO73DRAFT_11229 [Trametes versicolor]